MSTAEICNTLQSKANNDQRHNKKTKHTTQQIIPQPNHDNNTNFPNNWVPGFNAVIEESKFGVGYNYSISYLIPIFKKPKVYKESEEAKKKRLQEASEEKSIKKAQRAANKEEKKSSKQRL